MRQSNNDFFKRNVVGNPEGGIFTLQRRTEVDLYPDIRKSEYHPNEACSGLAFLTSSLRSKAFSRPSVLSVESNSNSSISAENVKLFRPEIKKVFCVPMNLYLPTRT